jgi:hypothetical protein
MRAATMGMALVMLAGAVGAAMPRDLPPGVRAAVPEARLQGQGVLRFLGIAIYDAYYWRSQKGYTPGSPFALELHYHRPLEGGRIARRSVEEIAALGYGSAEDRERWGREMTRVFPDVRPGDRIIGVNVPRQGARFFHNGEPIGSIDDAAFTRAFFGIWFDQGTSRPDLRRQLLGEP